MFTKASQILPTIELISHQNSEAVYILRRNFIPTETIDQLTNIPQLEVEFEQVYISVNAKINNEDLIKSNFDNWFQQGIKIEKATNEIVAKQKEMDKLINNYQQLNLNTELKINNLTAFQSIGTLYIENLSLKKENTKLKASNLNSMMAIAELYNMMGGSTNG